MRPGPIAHGWNSRFIHERWGLRDSRTGAVGIGSRHPLARDAEDDAGDHSDSVNWAGMWEQPHLAFAVIVDAPPAAAEAVPRAVSEPTIDRASSRTGLLLARQALIPLGGDEPDRALGLDAEHAERVDLFLGEPTGAHATNVRMGWDSHPRRSAFGYSRMPNAELPIRFGWAILDEA